MIKACTHLGRNFYFLSTLSLVFLSVMSHAEMKSNPHSDVITPPGVNKLSGQPAYESWIKSARKGQSNAQFNLGLILEQGIGVKKNLSQAVFWYRKAAAQGHTIAQYNYATMLHFGKGTGKDETEAAKWYELAARKGHIVAQSSLAYLYLQHSQSSFRNTSKAAYWYNKAAKLGYPEAQFNLGLLYASGRGLSQDYIQAYAWFDLAYLNKYKNALKSRNSAASRLDQKQIKDAMQLSKTLHQLYFRKAP